jgi:hypothetical protein
MKLAKLGKNSFFGQNGLITSEVRSASIIVISEEAKCLRMTKVKFEELLSAAKKSAATSGQQIGQNVLDSVPLFKSMTAINKKKLLEAMEMCSYQDTTYICRQGTAGNFFGIITQGICKVTINQPNNTEKEVARLHPGDFFGKYYSKLYLLLLLLYLVCNAIIHNIVLLLLLLLLCITIIVMYYYYYYYCYVLLLLLCCYYRRNGSHRYFQSSHSKCCFDGSSCVFNTEKKRI